MLTDLSNFARLSYPLLARIPPIEKPHDRKTFVQPGTVISSWVVLTMLPAGAVAARQSPCRAAHPSHADAELRKAKVRQLCFAAGDVCHAPGSHRYALGLSGG